MIKVGNFPKIDVVILAGGKGTRIKKFLNGKPKPMIKIIKRDFVDYIIKKVSSYPVNKIFIMCGFRGNKIYKKYNNTFQNLVPISCIIEKKPLGTGGAIKSLKNKVARNFIVLNGDTYFDIDLSVFFKNKNKNKIIMSLAKNKTYNSNNKLICLGLDSKKKIFYNKKSKLFNGGIYFLNKNIFRKLNDIKKKFISFEEDFIHKEILLKKVYGIYFNNFFLDIGTKKNLALAKKVIPKITKKTAVFLDRDGVINIDKGYVFKIKDFIFKPNVIKILQKMTKNDFYIFIVTNQAGIAHGKFLLTDFINLQLNIKKYLFKNKVIINDLRFCPFHKNSRIEEYRKNSMYRKPGNLMIENIKKNWNLDLKKSFMIGDKPTDKICAEKSNLKFYYPKKNILEQFRKIIEI